MTATSSNNIIPFAFGERLVRVYKPNGEPWFVGKDVCEVLEIAKHHQALDRLDEEERGTCTIGTPRGDQTMIVVSEAGVFELIFRSRKPEAERFKKWIAREVLPALRKHGTYTLPGAKGVANNDPLAEFPTGDEALSIHLAKLATLKECRMIHGPRAASRLWRRLGMPQVAESVVEEMDEGRRCLAHLMATVVVESDHFDDITLRDTLQSAFNDHGDDQDALKKRFNLLAVVAPDEGLFVPNRFAVHDLFRGTPWANGRHMPALRRLPGTVPMKKSIGLQCRGTFIPMAVIEGMPFPAAAIEGNVVPLNP